MTGEIEKYGSGFVRIRKAIKDYPSMLLEVSNAPNGFLAEIKYEKQRDGVNDGVKIMLEIIKSVPGIKTSALAEQLKISKRTAERWIKKLRELSVIEYRGSPKTGGYFIKGIKRKKL